MYRMTPLLLLALGTLLLPGCIVQDIHDQIALSNEQLNQINDSFAKVERANQLLEELDSELQTLGSINENLQSMDQRIATLEVELAEVSAHLASLRKTINNIDSTIPFLSISGDSDEEADQLENQSSESPAKDNAEPATSDPKSAQDPSK